MLVEDYLWTMAARGRLVCIGSDGHLVGYCTFVVLASTDLCGVYPRCFFTLPPDEPTGTVIYVDQLLVLAWNRLLFKQIEQVITERVPQWQVAIWHRPGQTGDRVYTYRRRR